MTECLDKEGILRLAGFLPLEVFLKWFVFDPTRDGVLKKTHELARRHDIYKFRNAFVKQIAENWQSSAWVVATDSGKHQFGVLAKDLRKAGVPLLRNSYAVKYNERAKAIHGQTDESEVPSVMKAAQSALSAPSPRSRYL
jgi:hypothetical protein